MTFWSLSETFIRRRSWYLVVFWWIFNLLLLLLFFIIIIGNLPPKCNQEPLLVTDRDGRPREDLRVVYYFCVFGDGAMLGVS